MSTLSSSVPPSVVVILGAGYAGLMACARLCRAPVPLRLVVVSERPAFEQRIRLHEDLAGDDPAGPALSALLAPRGVTFLQARAERIDLPGRRLVLGNGDILPYDGLILAPGSLPACAIPGAREHAVQLWGRAAMRDAHARLRALPGTCGPVTVLGGGLTAIELASELAERFPAHRVRLITGRLPGADLSGDGQQRLLASLDRLGVGIVTGRIIAVEPGAVRLADGRSEAFGLCVDATGFRASPVLATTGLARDAQGRIRVDDCLRAPGCDRVYVAGDSARVASYGDHLRMACATAMPMGVLAGENLAAELAGRPPRPLDFGYFARFISLGRRDGLTQRVGRDDTPQGRVVSGRRAAWYKEWICRMTLSMIRWELATGLPLYVWPRRAARYQVQPG